MPGASYPKPDGEKRNRAAPAFGWTELPAKGRKGRTPALPPHPAEESRAANQLGLLEPGFEVGWQSATRRAWKELWHTPQATQWDPSGRSLHPWLRVYDEIVRCQQRGEPVPASYEGELRQIEDRHGLNPKSLLQLRWRIVDEDADEAPLVSEAQAQRRDRRRRALQVIEGGD